MLKYDYNVITGMNWYFQPIEYKHYKDRRKRKYKHL